MRNGTLWLVFGSLFALIACGGGDGEDPSCDLDCVHGACHLVDGAPACLCENGFEGELCDQCPDGEQDNDGDGVCAADCSNVDFVCVHGACDDSSGTAQCACTGGYEGALCDACPVGQQDKDENGTCADDCATAALACVHGACQDSSGTAVCACTGGYEGTLCDACPEGLQDNDLDGVCAADCASVDFVCVNGACDDASGTALCVCTGGYEGALCDTCPQGMQDKDSDGVCAADCSSVDFVCLNGACDDSSGMAQCACTGGYEGVLCDTCPEGMQDNDSDGVCEDDCASAALACVYGTCDDTLGTALCACELGWGGALCDTCAEHWADDGAGGCLAPIGEACQSAEECRGDSCLAFLGEDGVCGDVSGCDAQADPDAYCVDNFGGGRCLTGYCVKTCVLGWEDQCCDTCVCVDAGGSMPELGMGFGVCMARHVCGNGTVEMGEDCDPPVPGECSPTCENEQGLPAGSPCETSADCMSDWCVNFGDVGASSYFNFDMCSQRCDLDDPNACATAGQGAVCQPWEGETLGVCVTPCADPQDCHEDATCSYFEDWDLSICSTVDLSSCSHAPTGELGALALFLLLGVLRRRFA